MILMTEMVLGGDSYEKSCWKWSRNHCGTTDMSMGNHHVILGVILGVILRVVYVILMTEIVLGGDSYEKSCWKWSRNHTGTTDRSMGNHHGDPRGDPKGDSKGGICDPYDGNGFGR